MDLANTVIEIEPGENLNVAIGTQDFWNVSADERSEEIHIFRKGKNESILTMPFEKLKLQFREAKLLIIEFAADLENHLKSYNDLQVTSDEIKFWFGLDKVRNEKYR
jgi:hypothetical protein